MDVRLPDGTVIRGVPDGMSKADLTAKLKANGYDVSGVVDKPSSSMAGDLLAGAVRGAGSIGATLLRVLPNALGGDTADESAERRSAMDGALQSLGADTDSLAFSGGKLATEIAGTAGVGGVLARPLAGLAPRLAEAIGTAGFRTGAPVAATIKGKAGDIGLRMAGGGAAGAGSAGLVNPEDAGVGAGIGAALPPALKAAGAAGGVIGRGISQAMTPAQVQAAQQVARAAGMTLDQLKAALSVNAGPSLIPGDAATVPQLLQKMGVSQLARTVHNAGGTQLAEREGQNALARIGALDRISPVSGTVQQSADNFGNALEGLARPAERAADKATSAAYRGIDPFNETAIELPLDELRGVVDKYLGPGTFGKGFAAKQGLQTAEAIGTTVLPAVKAAKGSDVSLVQAVRQAGGLSMRAAGDLGGELRALRQDMKNVVNNAAGLSPARMAEKLHQSGYLPDDDAVTLLNALREDPDAFAMGGGGGAYGAGRDAAMGEAPGATTIPKAIPYQQLDNLRKSLGDALRSAVKNEQTVDAGALRSMIAALDAKVERVAGGGGGANEVFPDDIAQAWKKARELHKAQTERFNTGPQAQMFRRGADGLPIARGGELAGKFINSTRGQTDDASALQRLIQGDQGVTDAARNYIATDAAGQTNALGQLTSSKFGNWRDARSGMLETLLPDQDNALLKAISGNLGRAESAQRLGMAAGSNTQQNIQSALDLGLLDMPLVNILANKVPLLGQFTGPALGALKDSARKAKANTLGELLADPEALQEALSKMPKDNALRKLLLEANRVSPALYRAAPVLSTSQ